MKRRLIESSPRRCEDGGPVMEGERFVIRWVNGVWVIYDTHKMEHARVAGTRKDIERIYKTGK